MKFDGAGSDISMSAAKKYVLESNLVDPATGKVIYKKGQSIQLVGGDHYANQNHGGVQLSQQQPGNYYTKTELLGFLGGYSPANYRHQEGVQEIPVTKDEFIIRLFGTDHGFSLTRTRADEEGAPNEIKTETSTSERKVQYHRIGFFAPRNVARQAMYDILKPGLQLASRVLLLNRELHHWGPAVAGYNDLGVLVDPANWNTSNTSVLGAGFQWGGPSGQGIDSDPLADLDMMNDASLNPLNEVWLNRRTWMAMINNSTFIDKMRARLGATEWNANMMTVRSTQAGRDRVKISFWPFEFCIIDSKFKHPDTGVMTYTMPDGVVLGLYKAPNTPGVPVDGSDVATAYTWTRTNATTGGMFGIRTAVNEIRGHGGELYIAEMGYECNRVGEQLGYLLRGAIQ